VKKKSGKKKMFLKIFLVLTLFAVTLLISSIVRNHFGRDFNVVGSIEYLQSLETITPHQRNPNIVVILADDLGYGDLSCYGSTGIKTPSIDRLAENGVKLTNFYSSSPVCSPSRAGLLTGRYPVRAHVPTVFYPTGSLLDRILSIAGGYSYGLKGIPQDEILLPEVLKKAGYATAIVGKWHIGDESPHLPNENGFDHFYGALYSNDMKPYAIYRNSSIEQKAPADQDNLTRKLTEEALIFIKDNKDHPFFLYYAQPFPHIPLHASKDFMGTSFAGLYGDTVTEIDWSVEMIIKLLGELNLEKNTLVIFTSDNGPWFEGSVRDMRGRKGLTYEGGQKVPFIACWPGTLPKGREIDEPAMNIDIFPTCLGITGMPVPNDRAIDGKNIFSLLTNRTSESPHEFLYFFWGKNIEAVRYKNWKYHRKHKSDISTYWMLKPGPYLFNLQRDPDESYSLINSEPEITKKLDDAIIQMQQSLKDNLRGWQ